MAECRIPRHGRQEGVPLRFPRSAMVPAAIGLAVACVALSSAPTLADQVRDQEWWIRSLHVAQAWRTTEGSGVTVAVLDTGTDPMQPDLAGSVLTGPDFTHSGETAASPYFYAHGTAVASLIAGHGHGSGRATSGVVGIAPAARILSVRVTLAPGDPLLANARIAAALPAAIAAGIKYAARQGAQVIDLPLDPGQAGAGGTPAAAAAAGGGGGSLAEQAAIDYALRKGAVVVAPAGDDGGAGNAANFPAAYPGVISVGSFNSAIIKSPFSIRQGYVTLTAPGQGVIAASTTSGYAVMNSTSAASAIVAGIAALVRSQFPDLTPAQVTQALKNGTVFHPGGTTGSGSGAGTVDAARALTAAAALAGPGVARAGTGALPQALPVAPPLPTVRQPLTSARLEKDGLISGAVLLLLLLLIAGLAAARRRRDRRPAFGAADEPGWNRYPETEGNQGEPALAYLAAPSAQAVHAPASHGGSRPLTAAGLRAGSVGTAVRDVPARDAMRGDTAGRESVWGRPVGRMAVWNDAAEDSAGRDAVWGDPAGRDPGRRKSSSPWEDAPRPSTPSPWDDVGRKSSRDDASDRDTADRETAGLDAAERDAAGRDAPGATPGGGTLPGERLLGGRPQSTALSGAIPPGAPLADGRLRLPGRTRHGRRLPPPGTTPLGGSPPGGVLPNATPTAEPSTSATPAALLPAASIPAASIPAASIPAASIPAALTPGSPLPGSPLPGSPLPVAPLRASPLRAAPLLIGSVLPTGLRPVATSPGSRASPAPSAARPFPASPSLLSWPTRTRPPGRRRPALGGALRPAGRRPDGTGQDEPALPPHRLARATPTGRAVPGTRTGQAMPSAPVALAVPGPPPVRASSR